MNLAPEAAALKAAAPQVDHNCDAIPSKRELKDPIPDGTRGASVFLTERLPCVGADA